jgi:2,4-dienoyl-CoA reductase-like NADH-dependent reductase (Old Yellow Enzyme family)
MANASHIDVSRQLTYGYQVRHAARIRAEADIKTMAVGLIIHADHAEKILRDGQADLVALGREMLHNPNWPIDAAQKLGVEPSFAHVPAPYGYWLEKRARSSFEGRPSTWQKGMEPEADPAAGG